MNKPFLSIGNINFNLEVLVNGQSLEKHSHEGKTYFAGVNGANFTLRVSAPPAFNGSTCRGTGGCGSRSCGRGCRCMQSTSRREHQRYVVVVAVDGLSVTTGKLASVRDGGYILDTRPETENGNGGVQIIPGYRLSKTEVALFKFGARDDSYAAQMDKPNSIGVISAVFFAEQKLRAPDNLALERGGPRRTRGGSASKGGFGGHDLGTEFGDVAQHEVTYVPFNRGPEVARVTLEYASRESLLAAGIIKEVSGHLNPFPADEPANFCQPPSGWSRDRNRRG